MKKYAKNLRIVAMEHLKAGYAVLRLSPKDGLLPEMRPGQFVEVEVKNSPSTFLRRPISINFVDFSCNELWLLVHAVGEGTRRIVEMRAGEELNCVFPLGNGFSIPKSDGKRLLLVGGGVGTAPLLQYGKMLREAGCEPVFLLGGKCAEDILQLPLFQQFGKVYVTTEDGSKGVKGFVTAHPVFLTEKFDSVATCGPKPMMVAVAKLAAQRGLDCEASLENLMACGLGACLCCVEKMKDGCNACVCSEGPVFNTKDLLWLN